MHVPEIYRVVSAILTNAEGEVLLQQRDEKPGLRYAGYWTLFGGAVEADETPDDAIQRELLEELELVLPLTFWKAYQCPARTIPDQVITTNYVYLGTLTRDLSTLTLHEGQAMRYFSKTTSADLTLAFMQSPILAAFFEEFS